MSERGSPTFESRPMVSSGPRFDAVTLLTIWIVLLFGISARQIVPGFGAIGSPAMLLAISFFLLWVAGWVLPESGLNRDPHPMRTAILVLLSYQLFSYAVAMSRPVTELEQTGSLRALITAFAMAGLALVVADGVQDLQRLTTLLRRVVGGATFVSALGIAQFFTRSPLLARLPGLTWSGEHVGGVGARSIFGRPSGTTLHPIEFSVITASLLPLAIHFALYAPTARQRRNAATAAALIALAVPMSVSRSGLVSLVLGLIVLAFSWSWRRRLNAALITVAAVPILWAAIPGLVGTLVGLFSNTDTDPSIQARLDRRPRIMAQIRERPWLGLGNGTWSTDDYFLIDNELYVTTLEMGLLGISLTIVVIAVGILTALSIRSRRGVTSATAHLAQAVGASTAALAVSILTFDAFHYRILTASLFLLLGAAGALWRVSAPKPEWERQGVLPLTADRT
jgi:O-antigen ligase